MDQEEARRIHDELASWRKLVAGNEKTTVVHQVALQLLDYIEYLEEECEELLGDSSNYSPYRDKNEG